MSSPAGSGHNNSRSAKHQHPRMLPRKRYFRHQFVLAAVGAIVVSAALFAGMLGYHLLAEMTWIDSFLNASMILGGMGPVDPLKSDAAKIFAGLYALFSGAIFLVAVGVAFSPLLHRLLHRFHLDATDDSAEN